MAKQAKPFWWRGGWYTDAGGKRTLLAFGKGTRKEAEVELAKLLVKIKEERLRAKSVRSPNICLKQLIDRFAEDQAPEMPDSTLGYYRSYLRYLVKEFGNKRAKDLTREMAMGWRKKLLEAFSTTTVSHCIKTARRLFNWALDRSVLGGANPFNRVPAPAVRTRKRLMTPEEYTALCKAAYAEDLVDLFVAMRYTAARPGDLRKLEWAMVDWERKIWVLPEHKTSRTTKDKLPKIIAFPPEVEEVLKKRRQTAKTPFVFTTKRGKPWKACNLGVAFSEARDKAGILPDAKGETLVMYCARHTILTEAVRAGVTGPQLQVLGGWTSLNVAKRYVHLSEQDAYTIGMKAADAMRKLDNAKDGDKE